MLLAALLLALAPLPLAAQFDDEFDSEFEEEFEEEPEESAPERDAAETDSSSTDAASSDDFDDEGFDDGGFGDGGFGDGGFSDGGFSDDGDEPTDGDTSEGDDTSGDEDADADAEESEPADDIRRRPRDDPEDDRRGRMFNSWFGPTGGFHLVDGLTAPPGTFRVQLGIEFFAKDGFHLPNDSHSRVGGTLSLSWTVHDMVELFASLESYANSNSRQFPNLLLVLGDVQTGLKVGKKITPWLGLAGDVRALVPTGSALGLARDGLGVGLRMNATADLRALEDARPFIARLNLGYRFDRTERLIDQEEDLRYEQLPDPLPREDETRHLITRVERYALSINRTDFFDIGAGVEIPLEVSEDVFLSPILEWQMGIPVNRQGYDCPFVPAEPGGDEPAPGDDDCLDRTGVSSFPSTLTLGARVRPGVAGLETFLAFDVGLTGRSRSSAVRELASNEPWRLLLGLSYSHDTRGAPRPPPIRREREVEVEIPWEGPPEGRVRGRVVVIGTEDPVPGARITYTDRDGASRQLAGDDGHFVSYRFAPGPVAMNVTADGMHPGSCNTLIPEDGGDVEITCALQRQLVEVEDEQVVILEQIQFAFDSAEILPESFPLMRQIAEAIQQNPQILRIEIQGHTDDQGSYDYNARLSQNRAESVQTWLVEAGVDAGRLSARGYGESRPLVREETEEARATNRRVEFRIMERASE